MPIEFVNSKLTEELRKTGASVTKENDQSYKNFLNPKVTAPGQYYRLRLLYFADTTHTRTIPFIEKYTHTVYEYDEDGKFKGIDFVTCPSSPSLNIENGWMKCPCCQYANSQYELAKSSEWKNKTALQAKNKMQRQFVAFLPVLVIQDPNIPANSGQVKMFNIRDKKAYEQLTDIIKATEYQSVVFKGVGALDLAVVIQEKPNLDKEGNPRINKNTGEAYTHKEFMFKFSDTPYDIEIPIDQVEALGFDDSMYTFSSESELNSFLTRHTISANIPQDDIKIDLSPEPAPAPQPTAPAPQPTAPAPQPQATPPADDMGFNFGGDEQLEAKPDPVVAKDIDFDLTGGAEPAETEKLDVVSGDVNLDDVLADFADLGDIEDIPM